MSTENLKIDTKIKYKSTGSKTFRECLALFIENDRYRFILISIQQMALTTQCISRIHVCLKEIYRAWYLLF